MADKEREPKQNIISSKLGDLYHKFPHFTTTYLICAYV